MTRLATRIRTYLALRPANLARVAAYRLALRAGRHPVQRIATMEPRGPFFARPVIAPRDDVAPPTRWDGDAELFGFHRVALSAGPPDWLLNPLSGVRSGAGAMPWWRIPDFDPAIGDIKLVWEWSRMDWVIAFAQRARQGDAAALDRLNLWLADWATVCPPYLGPNWKCGQEASIRVMHLAMAALILGSECDTLPGLLDLIEGHLRRIAPTLAYATAQDNNHGTSEAAALFIGGTWLARHGRSAGARWARAGRARLEERVASLVMPDGSFSQYSVTYHRVMLDTLVMAEAWRRRIDSPVFSPRLNDRARAATGWLRVMVSPETGDVPNVGANDGARLLPLTETPYRDFRPTVQLATALFGGRVAYEPGPHDDALRWLDIATPTEPAPPVSSATFPDGGFAVLRVDRAMALVRFPRFRFRPSHADALHVDFWLGSDNVLRDGGTYSYNDGDEWVAYFGGVAAHNTIQFDDSDQMPRLGRFLLGDWLATDDLEPVSETPDAAAFAAGYRDRQGRRHHRGVRLEPDQLAVTDTIAGFAEKAVLRWRLAPGDWRIDGTSVTNDGLRLSIEADVPIVRCELVVGHESRHYLDRTELPVLEIEVARPGVLSSRLRWA